MASKKNTKNAATVPSESTPESEDNALIALGKSLFARFRFELPSEAESDESDELSEIAADLGSDVSFTKILLDGAMESASGNLVAFIKYCENASKILKKSARLSLKRAEEYYLAWASGFAPKQSIKLTNGKGSALELDKSEFERSTKAFFYAMGKISNTALFGKKASGDKQEVKSIFRSPGKVAKIEGFESGEGGTHHAEAIVSHYILDNEGNVEGSLTLFGVLAKQLNNRDAKGFASTWKTLRGIPGVDSRYNFEEWAMEAITQGRLDGMIAAQFDEQIRKAQQALEANRQYEALNASDRLRVQEIKRLLLVAKNEEQKQKTETLGDSSIPAPDTKATDASDPKLTLERMKRELDAEMQKPESSDDSAVEIRNGRKVKMLTAQIAALEPAEESTEAIEPADESAN